MVHKFFDEKFSSLPDESVSGSGVNKKVKPSKQLAGELHKPIIKFFLKKNSLF